jgi:ubiquinol-cytochrome c reductase subunit 7
MIKCLHLTLTHALRIKGLRYEDILNQNEKEIAEALSFADPDTVTGRSRRVKRAMDLSFKRKNFKDYAPDVDQETFKSELYDDVMKIKARNQEYALLNAHSK